MSLTKHLGLRARVALFFVLIGFALVISLVATIFWLSPRLDSQALSSSTTALVVVGFGLLGLVTWVALKFDENLAQPIIAIAADLKTIAHSDGKAVTRSTQAQYLGLLGPAANETVSALDQARTQTKARIDEAMQYAARQQAQLESLLHELHHGVVMCSLQGRVSLYNRHAISILHVAESETDTTKPSQTVFGALGLGRNLFDIVDPIPFTTAVETLKRADNPDRALPIVFSTQDGAVTMRGHVSLHAHPDHDNQTAMTLVFADVTDELAAGLERDRLLRESSAILQRCRAMTDMDTLHKAIAESQNTLERASSGLLASAWPTSDMPARRIFRGALAGLDTRNIVVRTSGDDTLVHGDSATLISLLHKLLTDMAHYNSIASIHLEASANGFGRTLTINAETLTPAQSDWINDALNDNANAQTAHLSGNAILERHRATCTASAAGKYLDIVMHFPLNASLRTERKTALNLKPSQPRPEFYDFEIVSAVKANDVAKTPLRHLDYVVFDCEMTGLDPRAGDEIVSIAGLRVVNGRVLSGEAFDQLVNPGMPIPPSSTAIHHVTDEMVAQAPDTGRAIASFHRFARGHILVAHNAAFDMAFLARSQKRANVSFDHIVLDTVLLAAHLQGTSESLTLDALCDRYAITIPDEDRHTALGDALATAQLFCKLLKPLESVGIITIEDALSASRAQTALRRKQQSYS